MFPFGALFFYKTFILWFSHKFRENRSELIHLNSLKFQFKFGDKPLPPKALKSSVIRQKGESQSGCFKKTSTPNFPKIKHFLPPDDAHVRARIRG